VTKLLYRSDNLIELVGPTDEALQAPITGATVVSRCYAKDFDCEVAKIETRCLETVNFAVSSDVKIPKLLPMPFEVGDVVALQRVDATTSGLTWNVRTLVSRNLTNPDYDVINFGALGSGTVLAGAPLFLQTKAAGAGVFIPVSRPIFEDLLPFLAEVRLDNGTLIEFTANRSAAMAVTQSQQPAIDHPILPHVFTGTLTSSLSIGQPIRRKLGAGTIAMSQYGTPVAYGPLWGYRGTLQQTHEAVQRLGRRVAIEIDFSGGGLDLLSQLEFAVVRG
jgi:hypothetical protein